MSGSTSRITLCPLASGSKGNAYLLEAGSTTVLVDCGLSLRQLTRRMEEIERNIAAVDHLFVTHEHADHIKGLAMLLKKHRPTIWTSRGTLHKLRGALPEGAKVRMLNGNVEQAGELQVETVKVSHDAAEPVAFRFNVEGASAAVLTDLGEWTPEVLEAVGGADLLVCEANHDPHMLQNGPYPFYLKQRVASVRGHLSNDQGAAFALEAARRGTKSVLLGHLSETNNSPGLALDVFQAALEAGNARIEVDVAVQDRPGPWIRI